jgi:hypothetical protein
MGAEKRRRQASNYPPAKRAGGIEIRDPTDYLHIPGTLTIQVLHDNGASLSGSVVLADVDPAIRAGRDAVRQFGESHDAREAARTYIADALWKEAHLRDKRTFETIIVIALWLAWTVPEPQRAEIRERLKDDTKLVLALTEHSIYGRRAINGRVMLFSPAADLAEILQAAGMGPGIEAVSRKLAPQH